MRWRVRCERHRFAGQVFDAVNALLANHAIRAARPIHHEECVSAESLLLELRVVLGPNVRGRQHYVDVVGRQCRRAFGPVVDDFEADLQAFLVVDRARHRVEPAIGHQARGATDPDIHPHPRVVTSRVRRRGRYYQGLGGVDRFGRRRLGMRAEQPAHVHNTVSIETVAHQPQSDQEN